MSGMTTDQDLETYADPNMGQFFLVAPEKIARIVEAAGIRASDRVVEVGAGAGTIARRLPECKSLTLVELDARLIPLIHKNVPQASRVIHGDGLDLIKELPCEVLLGNLPNEVTEDLFGTLPSLGFRTAVLAVGEHSELSGLDEAFECSEVTTITGRDFRPPQGSVSRIVRLGRKRPQPLTK